MLNFDYITKKDIKEHNVNWSHFPWRFRIWKNKLLVNLISHQTDVDKIYLHAKDQLEAKYQLLINKREGAVIKDFHDSEVFIEYSNDMYSIFKEY